MTGFCFGILIMWCPPQSGPIEDFCTLYERVIVAKGDAAIAAPIGVKRRLLANELKYKKFCGGK